MPPRQLHSHPATELAQRISAAYASQSGGDGSAAAVVSEVQSVLRQAMALGGSSLKDFKDAHGSQGHFQLATTVYGREGEPCRVCRTPVKRVVQGQRSTFFCPNCQKR